MTFEQKVCLNSYRRPVEFNFIFPWTITYDQHNRMHEASGVGARVFREFVAGGEEVVVPNSIEVEKVVLVLGRRSRGSDEPDMKQPITMIALYFVERPMGCTYIYCLL